MNLIIVSASLLLAAAIGVDAVDEEPKESKFEWTRSRSIDEKKNIKAELLTLFNKNQLMSLHRFFLLMAVVKDTPFEDHVASLITQDWRGFFDNDTDLPLPDNPGDQFDRVYNAVILETARKMQQIYDNHKTFYDNTESPLRTRLQDQVVLPYGMVKGFCDVSDILNDADFIKSVSEKVECETRNFGCPSSDAYKAKIESEREKFNRWYDKWGEYDHGT